MTRDLTKEEFLEQCEVAAKNIFGNVAVSFDEPSGIVYIRILDDYDDCLTDLATAFSQEFWIDYCLDKYLISDYVIKYPRKLGSNS